MERFRDLLTSLVSRGLPLGARMTEVKFNYFRNLCL